MTESKFCPNCGVKQEKEAKFCPQCGYDFESKAVLPKKNETIKKSSLSKVEIMSLLKNKKVLAGIAVVIILWIASIAFGGVDIAGSYESEDTIADAEYSTTIEIARNGKLILKDADFADGMNAEMSFHIVRTDAQNGYIMDVSKGIELEFRVPYSSLTDSSYAMDVDFLVSEYGLEKEETDGEIILSGEMTALEASNVDLDFVDTEILQYEGTDNILFDDTIFIKR